MKRADKLKTLQDALQGQTGPLRQLHRQRQRETMPYLDVHGFVDIQQCSPLLLDLMVMPTESILDGIQGDHISLRDCLARFAKIDPKRLYYCFSAVGALDGNDSQYDSVPLYGIFIQHRDYSRTYLKGGTVADLRRYFHRSASCFDDYSLLLLSFETKLPRFDFEQQTTTV